VDVVKSLLGPEGPSKRPGFDRSSSGRSVLAFLAVTAFVAVPLAGPSASVANGWFAAPLAASQPFLVTGVGVELEREALSVSGGWGERPEGGRGDAGGAQDIAFGLVESRGWGSGEFSCLVALWSRESGWNSQAENPHSGAYGIPQALPASKMASAGADWASNPETQIRWGLGYIDARYGTPCEAWGHSERKGWY
jgi:hypothetical protein